jgi:superfamily II DNA or RNA helicase
VSYSAFLETKRQLGAGHGFEPLWMPDFLFPFQRDLVDWTLRRGRAAIFADCGLGKTPMQLVWAENVHRKTNKPVLILTPLAVSHQTVREGEKFGIEVKRSRDGKPASNITVTNYEQLTKFDPADYVAVVADESGILKHFSGATQKQVTRFAAKLPYRLLCTATPAPNDYIELGTSSEALGEIDFTEMRRRFFVQDETPHRMEEIKRWRAGKRSQSNTFAKLSFRVAQQGQWRLKGHAVMAFWRWVASWARACRMPSDLGFDDGEFQLPELQERDHVIKALSLPDGHLFPKRAFGLREEREERRRTINERCEHAADLISQSDSAVLWCHLNAEGDLLEKLIDGSVQVAGRHSDEEKEERIMAFLNGEVPYLVTKPKCAGFGLNMQHCAHVVAFASHSYEQYYQSIRRCWRFGQKRTVTADVICTEGEVDVVANMRRKSQAADAMFEALLRYMYQATHIAREMQEVNPMEVPSWL